MSAKSLTDNLYAKLEPLERFKLSLAAEARGDEFEVAKINGAPSLKTLTAFDTLPYDLAFKEICLSVFISLVERGATFDEWQHRVADDLEEDLDEDDNQEHEDNEDHTEDEGEPEELPVVDQWPLSRNRAICKACAFVLLTQMRAWEAFCQRLGADPLLAWDRGDMPGLERLLQRLNEAQKEAFGADEMVTWLNGTKAHAGKPPVTEADMVTAEQIADKLEVEFNELASWYGG